MGSIAWGRLHGGGRMGLWLPVPWEHMRRLPTIVHTCLKVWRVTSTFPAPMMPAAAAADRVDRVRVPTIAVSKAPAGSRRESAACGVLPGNRPADATAATAL